MNKSERGKFSRLRKLLTQLSDEQKQQTNLFFSDRPIIKGSIYELKSKCGKPNCRCAQGQHHSRMVVSAKKNGKTKLSAIPKGSLVEVQIKVNRYKKLRNARKQLIELHKKLIKAIDQMESMRLEETLTSHGKRFINN